MARERIDDADADLLARFLSGDERSFTTLMKRHEDRIFQLSMRILGNRTDALDATQETFITAFRKADQFRGDSAFGSWLYRIGINTCKDVLRKKRRWGEPEENVPEPETRAASLADEVSLRLDLSNALAALSGEYREAVVMFDLGGIPYEEIARITGTNLGTVKSRISRGRRKLAELMEQHGGRPPSKGSI